MCSSYLSRYIKKERDKRRVTSPLFQINVFIATTDTRRFITL